VSEPVVLHGLDVVRAAVGTALGPTDWVEITEDHLVAWERACPGASHGWLLLSLTNLLLPQMVRVEDVSAGLNIGTGAVELATEDVSAGTTVRAVGLIEAAEEVRGGAVQTQIRIHVEDASGTTLVAVESLSRWLP